VVHAKTLGLDIIKWSADKESDVLKQEIEYDISLAGAIGITGTPGFTVNGRVSKGWGSVLGVDTSVKAAFRAVEDLRKKGVDPASISYTATKQVDQNIAKLIWGVSEKEGEKAEL